MRRWAFQKAGELSVVPGRVLEVHEQREALVETQAAGRGVFLLSGPGHSNCGQA